MPRWLIVLHRYNCAAWSRTSGPNAEGCRTGPHARPNQT